MSRFPKIKFLFGEKFSIFVNVRVDVLFVNGDVRIAFFVHVQVFDETLAQKIDERSTKKI